jgi:ABC-type lipoprotein export system ATPase subunit
LAQGDTVTGRTVLIDDNPPGGATRFDPEEKPIAQLSQNMSFVLEMSVVEFLGLHAECRNKPADADTLNEVIAAANTLAGEHLRPDDTLTRLSGGQSRALMIADLAHISDSPIILIDEIENAGIDRRNALRLLTGTGKIVLIATHDPQLALLGESRVVMRNGGMSAVIHRGEEERTAEAVLGGYMTVLTNARERIRSGGRVQLDSLTIDTARR